MTDSIAVNSPVIVVDGKAKGATGTVAAINKGWVTVDLTGADTIKVRMKQLAFHVEQTNGDDEDEPSTAKKMTSALRTARTGYEKATSYLGKATMDCADQLAVELRGISPLGSMILATMVSQPFDPEFDATKKYGLLNEGQKRMNSGNKVRGAIKRELVTIEEVLDLIPEAKEKAAAIIAELAK